MDNNLKDMHVLITGASRGLGTSLAKRMYANGARISLVARSLELLERIKEELGDNVVVYGADLTDSSQLDKALVFFQEHHGPVDILINNAGSGTYSAFGDLPYKEIMHTYGVNTSSVAQLIHRLLPDLRKSKDARVLNVASDIARRPMAKMAVYSSAKHAIAGLSQSLARELKDDDIRVMLLNPGIIDTSFGGRQPGDIPPPYGLDPDHVAEVALFMLTRPPYLLMDEVTLHPMKQDF